MKGEGGCPRLIQYRKHIRIVRYTHAVVSRSRSKSAHISIKPCLVNSNAVRAIYVRMDHGGGGRRAMCCLYSYIRAYSTRRIQHIPPKIFYYNNLHFMLCFANYICILKYLYVCGVLCCVFRLCAETHAYFSTAGKNKKKTQKPAGEW